MPTPLIISQSGPLTGQDLRRRLDEIYTPASRLVWASNMQTSGQAFRTDNFKINNNGFFQDPDIETWFINSMFKEKFGNQQFYLNNKDYYNNNFDARVNALINPMLGGGLPASSVSPESIPFVQNAVKKWKEERIEEDFRNANPFLDSTENNNNDVYRIDTGRNSLNPFDTSHLTDATIVDLDNKLEKAYEYSHERYRDDHDGSLMAGDIETIREYAPQLSAMYNEYMAGTNNDALKWFNPDEMNWEKIAPFIMYNLDIGNYDAASDIFSREVERVMMDNQSFGSKAFRWGTRFGANVLLMGVDMISMGILTAPQLIVTAISDIVNGNEFDWTKYAGIMLGGDNWGTRLTYQWSNALREAMPIYGENLWGDSIATLLNPESMAFMASMFMPGEWATLIGRGMSLVGKTGRALTAAKVANKISGYDRNVKKAEKTLDNILSATDNVRASTLKNVGIEKEVEALTKGKTLGEARQAARQAQIEALAKDYQRGTVKRHQIMASSYVEAQWEAMGAKEATLNEYENALADQKRKLLNDALNGKVDLSGIDVEEETVKENYQALVDAGYLDDLYESMKDRWDEEIAQREANGEFWPEQQKEAFFKSQIINYVLATAELQARVDAYVDQNREEFDARANREANLAGLTTLGENYLLLRLTEGLGGWTTKLAPYQRMVQIGGESKNLFNRVTNKIKSATGAVTSFESDASQMMSRIRYDKTGKAYRTVTPKSVLQTTAKLGGTVGIEVGQELGQEAIVSGTEGTSHINAESFVMSQFAGPGREVVDDYRESQFLSLQYAGYNRTTDDFKHIAQATAFQMLTGTPTVLKYKNRFYHGRNAEGRRQIYDIISRGSHESTASYIWRQIEGSLPVNSPVFSAITDIANTNTDVRTFIKTYNNLLKDSQQYSNYVASSMNYAARVLDAASREDQTDYNHTLFAAQMAEAIFMAQQRDGKQRGTMVYYHNLADINTKRDGESDEDFQKRRENTLKELREDANFNSIKEMSDEDLSAWAEKNGKTMIDMVERVAGKIKQLYEQTDGNISWEELYATIYSGELVEYTNGQLKEINDILHGAINDIVNTEIPEEEKKDDKGNSIRIYNETEILNMEPQRRARLIQNAIGKQKTIVDNLIKQLEVYNQKNNLGRNIKEDIENAAKEAKIINEAKDEYTRLLINPKAFLRNIKNKKLRVAAKKIFKNLNKIFEEAKIHTDENNNRYIIHDNEKFLVSSKYTVEGSEYTRYRLSDELSNLNMIIQDPATYLNFLQMLDTLPKYQRDLIMSIMEADYVNGDVLENVVEAIIDEQNLKETELNDKYNNLVTEIRLKHIAFFDDNIKDHISEEYWPLLDEIKKRYEEFKKVSPRVEISQDPQTDRTDPKEESHQPAEISDEEAASRFMKSVKTKLKMELSKIINMLQIDGTEKHQKVQKVFNEIISQNFQDVNDVMLAINKAALNKDNEDIKKVLEALARSLKNYTPESFGEQSTKTQRISLADLTYFLNAQPDGNYANFYKRYKIAELLRSGKIKAGQKIYVMWDSEFVEETKKLYKNNTGNNATMSNVGLVAVVEGAIDGFEHVTIGDKTYTRIGLFRSYGKGEHNSRDVVSRMLSNVTDQQFDATQEIPQIDSRILSDKDNNPITFTISAMNESSLVPTPGERRSAKVLSEERQNRVDNEVDKKDIKGRIERAKQFFLDHLIIAKDRFGNKLPSIKIDRNNADGFAAIPVQIRPIVETIFGDTTVGQAILNGDTAILGAQNGNPMLYRFAEILRNFMGNGKAGVGTAESVIGEKVVKPAINKFLKELNKIHSEKEYNKKFPELIYKLNEECKAALNSKNGASLFNRLALPAGFEYYINYETREDLDGNQEGYFTIGVKHENDPINNEKNFTFMEYKAPTNTGATNIIYDDEIINALQKLIYDNNGNVRMNPTGTDPFVKWQINYRDVEHRAGLADDLLSELYDADVFTIETDNLMSSPLDIDIVPTSESMSIFAENVDETQKETDEDKEDKEQTDTSKEVEKRAEILKMPLTKETTYYREQINKIASAFKYGIENYHFGNNIKAKFIGLTETNELVIIVDDELNNSDTRFIINGWLNSIGFPHADSFILENASKYNIGTKKDNSNKEGDENKSQFSEEDYKRMLTDKMMSKWAKIMKMEGLYSGKKQDMEDLIERLKTKYGSYGEAFKVIRAIRTAKDLEATIKCC